VSFLIYSLGRKTFAHIITDKKNSGNQTAAAAGPELTPAQTKARVIALLLVFAVVIFFWMVFHQNGATLTEFAKSCTSPDAYGATRIGFNVWALLVIAVGVYALFNLFQSKSGISRLISGLLIVMVGAALWYFYAQTPDPVSGIQPQQYQQFNPFYVVALTPVSLAIFAALAKKGKEPSAPRKIGLGMLMAALAYALLMLGSFGLDGTSGSVSPNWLISTYLLLTFAELLLSPMGISFVSKVAPPKLKGSMMGGWFAATAIGNYLVSIPMLLWGKMPVYLIWIILIAICLVSAGFIFSIMKKLEAATSDSEPVPAKVEAEAIENVEDDAI
ncbi:MAG: MFS transporter, partial [Muribaculaceae bacterium]|nr:MFS transporter [Muribaculaceae bacterium]